MYELRYLRRHYLYKYKKYCRIEFFIIKIQKIHINTHICNIIHFLIKLYYMGIFSRDYPIYFLLNPLIIYFLEEGREKEREKNNSIKYNFFLTCNRDQFHQLLFHLLNNISSFVLPVQDFLKLVAKILEKQYLHLETLLN